MQQQLQSLISHWHTSIINFVKPRLSISDESLAVFRIGMGVLLVVDVLLRSRNLTYYYTNRGVLPFDVVLAHGEHSTALLPLWSFSSSPITVSLVFTLAAITGILLIIGHRTRVVTILGFFLVSLIDSRNPAVLSYADIYYHLLFFWAMFLPLGNRWSIDAIRRSSPSTDSYFSFGTTAVLLQVVYMYTQNGLGKFEAGITGPTTLLYEIVYTDHITYSHTPHVLGIFGETGLYIMSYVWAVLIITSIALILFYGRTRIVLLSMFIGSHLLMAFTVRVGAFPYVSITALMLFIPAPTWNTILSFIPQHSNSFIQTLQSTLQSAARTYIHHINRITPRYMSRLPNKETVSSALVYGYVFVIVLSLTVSTLTIAGVDGFYSTSEDHVTATIDTLGIDQPTWRFFGSGSTVVENYYTVNVTTTNGEKRDIFNNRPATDTRPYPGSQLQKQFDRTYRDRFFYSDIADSPRLTQSYLKYYCRTYQSPTGTEPVTVTFTEYEEAFTAETIYPRSQRGKPTVVNHYERTCYT